ncbi:uromodulin-like [Sceloporus undulatus]|uniref:uromodulin-like n=1 Tax=Sceloporus undulatus TaxID=8520 RepID=UPI001C4A7E7E|nr:uromodulin-like [Sceloporus undulatus]
MKMTIVSWLLTLALFLPVLANYSGHLMENETPKVETALRPRRNLDLCFPSPCRHEGDCKVVDNNVTCTCKPGFTGPLCKEMMVKLQCEEEYMKMLVRKEVFEMLKIPMALVHLKRNTCKVFEQDEDGASFWGAVLTGQNHTSCGSDIKVNGSHVSYANVIESDGEDQGVITRSILTKVHFSCIYAYKRVVGLVYPVRAMDTLVQFAVKEGDFTVSMALYDSETYQQAYRQQPLVLLITDVLYVLLQIEGQDQVKYFFLSVEDCWGTPTADPNHVTKHPLIMKGCPHDKTLTFLNEIGTSTVAKFSFQMFQFKSYSEVFLHCQVRLCMPDPQVPCAKECPVKRKSKRELVSGYQKIVSYGPIQFLVPSNLETRNAKDPESLWRLQLWIPGAMVSAGIAAVFVLIAVAKAMKK